MLLATRGEGVGNMHVVMFGPVSEYKFLRALAKTGVQITGLGMTPKASLPGNVKQLLDAYVQVSSLYSEAIVTRAVAYIHKQKHIDQIINTSELMVLPAARAREACGIPGVNYKQGMLCRDKSQMKDFMRLNDIPCAASMPAETSVQVREFARKYGYPIIIKPREGVASMGTYRIDNDAKLEQVLQQPVVQQAPSIAVEEFIEGHEGTYDTLTLNGEVVCEFVTHYFPNVLLSMKDPTITPYSITVNSLDTNPSYDQLKKLGRRVISALGLGTTPTHMEWLNGPKGLKFSEIGARPPAADFWDLYSAANEIDLYDEWAKLMIFGKASPQIAQLKRSYAAGLISIRPHKQGRVKGYSGLDYVHKKYSQYIFASRIPHPGEPTESIANGFTTNAWFKMRHPEEDVLKAMFEDIAKNVHMYAE
jgi:formate-dependent phosphoribosylglycinamide formyltransferase (GAR transformylase)